MLQIFHAARTRSFRLLWLCEELGLPYTVAHEKFGQPSPEFLAVSPLGSFPAIRDGEVAMVESVAIMLYILGRHGPTDLAVTPDHPDYGKYLQYLVFGEAGTAMWANPIMATKVWGPEGEKSNWTTAFCATRLAKQLALISEQLGAGPYLLGDRFTAADISVGYTIGMAKIFDVELSSALVAYLQRLQARPADQRAIAVG